MDWFTPQSSRSEVLDDDEHRKRLILAQERQRETAQRIDRLEEKVEVYRRSTGERRHGGQRRLDG
jgi:hypothetical protein